MFRMSSALRAKIEVVLETLNNTESEYSSYEELEEKVIYNLEEVQSEHCVPGGSLNYSPQLSSYIFQVRVSEDLSELEKFKVVLGIVCKHCINTKDKNWVAKLYGGILTWQFILRIKGFAVMTSFWHLVAKICRYPINAPSHHLKYFFPGGSDISFIAEMIIAYYNQNCHTYSSSPFFTFAEEQILKKVIGLYKL